VTEQPKTKIKHSTTEQIPLDRMDTSRPDLIANSDDIAIYAEIEQNPEMNSGNNDRPIYANITSQNNNEDSGDVVYSDLQRKNSVIRDMYATVQKL